MSWIILALTLGASITSIIHGVFMLFGSLTISGGSLFGIPSTMLASLPIISAAFALIGGIIAFNKSKWGALFLFIAGGLCVPSRDTWIYGGIYFLAGILCFLLRPDKHDEYQNILYDDDEFQDDEQVFDENNYPQNEDVNVNVKTVPNENIYYSQPDLQQPQLQQIQQPVQSFDTNNEPPKLRRRVSKICPECGAMVAREDRFCNNCGAKLFVIADKLEDIQKEEDQTQQVNEQLLTPSKDLQTSEAPTDFKVEIENVKVREINNNPIERDDYLNPGLKFDTNDGDDMSAQAVQNYRMVKPVRNTRNFQNSRRDDDMFNDAAESYQQFSKYTRRAKKRKRSAGRKILSMLLLVGAVGGALYFLLGLRKLPPGDLPPIARNDVRIIEQENSHGENSSSRYTAPVQTSEPVAQPQKEEVAVVVSENLLPNFNPDRTPKSGMVVGSNVNLRADHTTSSNRVARLNVNTRLNVLGTFNVTSGQHQGLWYNVETNGKEGWIYGRYVQPLGSGLPSGYSTALLKSFGKNKTEIVDALGNPTRNSSTSLEWPGITATLKGDEITRIRLTASNRELQNGLKVGMSQTALYQLMGFPSGVSNRIMQYNENGKTGLSVQLDKNNAISTITVNEIK